MESSNRATSATEREVSFTSFDAVDAPWSGVRYTDTWTRFVEAFNTPAATRSTAKVALPCWSGSVFEEQYRTLDTFEGAELLTFDVDRDPIPTEAQLREKCAPFAGLYHSTSRHTPSSPRWRLVLLLSRVVTSQADFDAVWRAVEKQLGFPVGQEAKDAARACYVWREPDEGPYVFGRLDGTPVDVDAILAAQPPATLPIAPLPVGRATDPYAGDIERAAHLLAPAFREGQRDAMGFAIAGACARAGFTSNAAERLLCRVAALGPAGNEDAPKRSKTVAKAYADLEGGEKPVPGWPKLASLIGNTALVGDVQRMLSTALVRDALKGLREARAVNDTNTPSAPTNELGVTFGGWDKEPEPTRFLVDQLIPAGAVVKLFGHADSLKTWIAFSLAVAVARGERWLDRYATIAGRVVIVDYETGKANLRRRLYMLGAGADPNLGARSMPQYRTNDPRLWRALAELNPTLVIVDSLRAGNPEANENDSGESIRPLLLAGEFAERSGATVVFIHHAKKDAGGQVVQRGSAAIKDQVDCSFVVKAESKSATRKRVAIECEKPGDMPTPPPFEIEVSFDDTKKTTTVKLAPEDAAPATRTPKQKVLTMLASQGPFTSEEALRGACGIGMSTLRSAWNELVGAGDVALVRGTRQVDSEEKRMARIRALADESTSTGRSFTDDGFAKEACVRRADLDRAIANDVVARVSPGLKSTTWARK